ncbi:diacylglycerol lipase-beta [Polypterus senegalus]|uniref:diacylglycerol lipase-beta n=1 Tax=Polypterus senegalus TaxID=55291 RepID=UPI001962B459|nr:diacylglycerol lipase-beta [Polypterus senegalus]
MPGLVVFGRRWGIASDDLVFPGAFELFVRMIWWILILVLYSMHKGQFDCIGGGVLHSYLIVLLSLLALIIFTLLAIIYVSMQGTITNPGPRRSIPTLIYIRTILYVPELVWACLGAMWVSDTSLGCEVSVVRAVIVAVIASWIILFFTAVAIMIVFDPLGRKRQAYLNVCEDHNLESSDSAQLLYTARSLAARVWENRIRLLCCCIMQDDDHRAAFSNIGQLFSDFFSDTDLVASDIAAGLSLIHQEQDKMEQCRDLDEVVSSTPLSYPSEDLDLEIERSAHYMRFAVAAYGWPMFVFSRPLTGVCKLSGDCCRRRSLEYDIVGGDHLGCHFTSMLYTTGLQYRDFIYISFHNKIYEIPFFVALDHQKEAVLVAVRGTLSLRDALTDLSADCETLHVEGVAGPCYAHKGITQAANYIYRKLVNDGILNQAFTIAPEYSLIITGHSLGAGTAAVLSILLRTAFPRLRCYAFSPPGGLLSKSLADYSKGFTISVVLGKDLVPRLSIPNMEDLKRRILRMVANCNKPKYRILLRGCWYEMFGGSPDDFPTELESRRQDLTLPLLADLPSPSYQSLASDDSSSGGQHPPLYLPGRILHITEEGSSGRSCFSDVKYHAAWAEQHSFCSVLISPKMITDHMPDVVLKALTGLTQDSRYFFCPTSRNNLNVV